MLPHFPTSSLPNSRRGTVLLLALVIMSSVVISSVALGSLILSSLQQTRAIDNAAVAYYAAESGIEEALYDSRRREALPATVSQENAITLGNGSQWFREVATTEPVLYAAIPQDSFLEVALYDPDAETSEIDIGSVEVRWTDDCGGCSVLVMGLVGWTPGPGGPFQWESNAVTEKYAGGYALRSVSAPLTLHKLHKLRLKAEKAALQNVVIKAYTTGGADAPLPGRLKISSHGLYGGTEQRLTVTVPRHTPLIGIYDFAVFSECSLVKGGVGGC